MYILLIILFLFYFYDIRENFSDIEMKFVDWQNNKFRVKIMNRLFHLSQENSRRIRTSDRIRYIGWNNLKYEAIIHPTGVTLVIGIDVDSYRVDDIHEFRYKDWDGAKRKINIKDLEFVKDI